MNDSTIGTSTMLRVGDEVRWLGGWGNNAEALARVTGIEITPAGEKHGEPASEVAWDASFVVDLDNGHWAYSYQLRPAA